MKTTPILDAIALAAEDKGQSEAAAWEEIKKWINPGKGKRGRLSARITIGGDSQRFKPKWIERLAKFKAPEPGSKENEAHPSVPTSPPPAAHPDGTTISSSKRHLFPTLKAKRKTSFDCTTSVPVPVTDFPFEGVVHFYPPGIVARGDRARQAGGNRPPERLRGEDFGVDAAQLAKLLKASPHAPPVAAAGAPSIDDTLAEWIFAQHPGRMTYEKLEAKAIDAQFGEFTKAAFRAAYAKVYETKPHRPPATGWPLRSPYKELQTQK